MFQVCNKIIFLVSFVGNRGTFTRGYKAMVMDFEFLYHLIYLIICCLGVFVHVFFYSLLVRETHTYFLLSVIELKHVYDISSLLITVHLRTYPPSEPNVLSALTLLLGVKKPRCLFHVIFITSRKGLEADQLDFHKKK